MTDKEILESVYHKLLREKDILGRGELPPSSLCVQGIIDYIEEEWQKADEESN